MSVSTAEPNRERACPRCETDLSPEQHRADHGVTWLWRCACGWSGAMTESGVMNRREVLAAVQKKLQGAGDGSEAPSEGHGPKG